MLQADGTNGAVPTGMKKETKPKKLTVVSTKIRELSDGDLKQAAGGQTPGGAHIVQQR